MLEINIWLKRLLFAGVFFVAFGIFTVFESRFTSLSAQGSLPACSNTVSFLQPISTSGTNALSGVVPIELVAETGAVKVVFTLDGKSIGKAQSDGSATNGGMWFMPWDTKYAEPFRAYALEAVVSYSSGNKCRTQPVPVYVENPFQAELNATLQPDYWQGPTNTVDWFMVDMLSNSAGSGTVPDPAFVDVQWSVQSRGTITPKPNATARFYSGPSDGNGEVRATVRYGGSEVNISAVTNIFAQYSPDNNEGDSSSSDDSTSGGLDTNITDEGSGSGGSSQSAASSPTVTIAGYIEDLTNSESETGDCFVRRLGSRYKTLLAENRRPSHEEFSLIIDCYKSQDYVIPSTFAPIAPDAVPAIKRSADIVVNLPANKDIITDQGDSQKTLILSGKATPNTTVIMYVYSEPLVLVAQSDDQGIWEYTLEDPLPGGNHEVYALVDRGDGEYQRSDVASFFIQSAEATEANPNGYSLELAPAEETVAISNRSVNVFVAATIGVTVFALTTFSGYLIYRFRNRQPLVADHTDVPQVMPGNSQDKSQDS